MKQLLSFIKKEFRHIFRDKRTVLVLIGMPFAQMLLFGFAISTEVKDARFAVYNPHPDPTSMELIEQFEASQYFERVHETVNPAQIEQLFRENKADVVLVFDNPFEKNLQQNGEAHLQVLTDGIDVNTSSSIANYAAQIVQSYNKSHATSAAGKVIIPEVRLLYNPQMKSTYNFVPGVMGLVLTIICAMMTAVSIVREKEKGTMEVLLVSPMRPVYIIIAKMLPYLEVSAISMVMIVLMAVFLLEVPMAGSLWLFSLISTIFILSMLALGLLISTVAENQTIAMLISGMGLMMPTALLSGMIFPVDNMPWLLRTIASVLPARWFIAAVRKIMIEGLSFMYIYKEFLILLLITSILLIISFKNFKTRLE